MLPFQVKLQFCYDPLLKSAVRKDGGSSLPFPGVLLWEDFLSKQEEEELVHEMDKNIWSPSQSGRKKQVVFYNQSTFMQRSVYLFLSHFGVHYSLNHDFVYITNIY